MATSTADASDKSPLATANNAGAVNPHSQSAGSGVARAILLLCLGVFAYESWAVQPQYDDSYITYRYARNFATGHGLVYNLGEYVEGYTNFLWTILVALGIWLGGDPPAIGHILGLLSGMAVLIATYVYARGITPEGRPWIAALPAVLLLAFSTFVYCSTNGMETPLFLAASTAALAAYSHNRVGLSVVFLCIATLTRPDGILIAAAIYGSNFLFGKGTLQQRLRPTVPYLILLVALTLFRVVYYGPPLPNTFYAKVGGLPWSLGFNWAWNFLSDFYLLIPAAILGGIARTSWPGVLFVALNFAYVVATSSTGPRLVLPIIPVLASLAAAGADRALAKSRSHGTLFVGFIFATIAKLLVGNFVSLTVLALATLAAVYWLPRDNRRSWIMPGAIALTLALFITASLSGRARIGVKEWTKPIATSDRSTNLSRRRNVDRMFWQVARNHALLLKRTPDINLVAAAAIGSLGYYSELPILDYLGLVDAVVARSTDPLPDELPGPVALGAGHQRSNAAYIMSRKPDLIMLSKKGKKKWSYLPAEIALWSQPDLERCYSFEARLLGYRRKPCDP